MWKRSDETPTSLWSWAEKTWQLDKKHGFQDSSPALQTKKIQKMGTKQMSQPKYKGCWGISSQKCVASNTRQHTHSRPHPELTHSYQNQPTPWTNNLGTLRNCKCSLLRPQVATRALGSDQRGGEKQKILQRGHQHLGFAGLQCQAESLFVAWFCFKGISCFPWSLQVALYLEPLLMRMLSRIVSVQ